MPALPTRHVLREGGMQGEGLMFIPPLTFSYSVRSTAADAANMFIGDRNA